MSLYGIKTLTIERRSIDIVNVNVQRYWRNLSTWNKMLLVKRGVLRPQNCVTAKVMCEHIRWQQQDQSCCQPMYPPACYPCQPCQPNVLYPPFYCCPRNQYQVNWIYINDVPPKTELKDVVDRISQTVFWTEIIRGEFGLVRFEYLTVSKDRR